MKNKSRYITHQVEEDLYRKMVFVAGARQVGKTTLAKHIFPGEKRLYLNWDIPDDRSRILEQKFNPALLWVFDEIHKYRKWRNYLKGVYDQHGKKRKILVTGSAKLDVYRFGGDSLQGRYHFLRMNPLSVAELKMSSSKDFHDFLHLSAFPEPFYGANKKQADRWTREHRSRVISEEITSLETVKDLGSVELLATRLPKAVGSPLSINSFREDLQVHHETIGKWLDIFDRLYMTFRVLPFGSPKIKAVKKEQKLYFYDWNVIIDDGPRFENMIGLHLLKWVHWLQDTEGRDIELRYYRDIDGREVDFVLTERQIPFLLVECKFSDTSPSSHLIYLKRKFPEADAWQVTTQAKKDFLSKDGVRIAHAIELLKQLV